MATFLKHQTYHLAYWQKAQFFDLERESLSCNTACFTFVSQQRNYHFSFLSLCSFHNSSFSKLLNVHLLLFLLFVFPPLLQYHHQQHHHQKLYPFSPTTEKKLFPKIFNNKKLVQSYALFFPMHTLIYNESSTRASFWELS